MMNETYSQNRYGISRTNYIIIQLHAVMIIVGFMFLHSVLGFVMSETGRTVSFIFRGCQLLLSLYVIILCHKDLRIKWKQDLLAFLLLFMVLYSLRVFYDSYAGPFVAQIPSSVFFENILSIIVSTFISSYAMMVTRRYLDINIISKMVFWGGLVSLIGAVKQALNLGIVLQEDRLETGGAFGVLQIAQMCAFVALSGFHLLLNSQKKWLRLIYLGGIAVSFVVAMATGARGSVLGTISAVSIYLVVSSRKNILLLLLAILAIVLAYINLVPILNWMSDYFPIFSGRMLETVVDKSTGGRDPLYELSKQLIMENPIFGYSYRLNTDATGYTTHNGILDIMLALGIPMGLLFTFIFYIKGFIMIIKKMPDKQLVFASSMAVFSLVASLSGSSITSPAFCFSICLFGSAYYYKKK